MATRWSAILLSTCLALPGGLALAAVPIDGDDIGGVVSGPKGPEAGVWVIAETRDLQTKFSRVVVTDDQGRYVIPDLPEAKYEVWVRGYGLVDSAKATASPGKQLDLKAVAAPDAKAAAQYYPADYWLSMLHIPAKSEFPGTGPRGNGIAEGMKSQQQWVDRVLTSACQTCHQMGNKATREIPEGLGRFENSVAAWGRRTESGQAGSIMSNMLASFGRQRVLEMYANWTDRIAAGEVPKQTPPRPSGAERNVVITNWDYGDAKGYLHDGVSTDKRNPTVNANGPIYGVPENASDRIAVLDPVANKSYSLTVPLRDPNTPYAQPMKPQQPSAYWGDEAIWDSKTSPHSNMMDQKGRVWTTSIIRPRDNPAWCKEGSNHPSAKAFPLATSSRQLNFYDPATGKFTLIDTCFSTHHVQHASTADNTAWVSTPGGEVAGWVNMKVLDETGDEQKAQGWTAFVLDTNGNGQRDDYAEPDAPVDPKKDKRIRAGFYAVVENPVDHTIWGSVLSFPGAIVRLDLGANPPSTTLTEIYEVPWGDPRATAKGYTPRGIDVDRNGVIWVNLSGSGHIASFDRRKCKGPLNGPTATGKQCPEGWSSWRLPGPAFEGVDDMGAATANYYIWVDQFDTFGLGRNVPIVMGNGSDSLLAFLPDQEKFVILRVPYPISFYAKLIDGRIDDAKAGWKGKGLWASSGTRAPWHVEGGQGERPKLTKFQLRPDPLAH